MTKRYDGEGFHPLEEPADRREIEERLEGLEVSRFIEGGIHPTGGFQFGLEFSSGARLLVTAVLDEQPGARFSARIRLDFLRPLVWRPTSRRLRRRTPLDDLHPLYRHDPVARGIVGNELVGIHNFSDPNRLGGEKQLWEFRDGARLWLGAVPVVPPRQVLPEAPDLRADLLFDFEPPRPVSLIELRGMN